MMIGAYRSGRIEIDGRAYSADVIITPERIVDTCAEAIEVGLFGEETKTFRALIVGRDALTDSALITLEQPPSHLQTATLGDSSALEPCADFGLTLEDITPAVAAHLRLPPGVDGALVVEVAADSSADRAGLRAGDIITTVSRRVVRGASEARRELARAEAGQPVFVLVCGDEAWNCFCSCVGTRDACEVAAL